MNNDLWKGFGRLVARDALREDLSSPDYILGTLRRMRCSGDMKDFVGLMARIPRGVIKSEHARNRLHGEMLCCCQNRSDELISALEEMPRGNRESYPYEPENGTSWVMDAFARVAAETSEELSTRLWKIRFAPYRTSRGKTGALIECLRETPLAQQRPIWGAVSYEDLHEFLPSLIEQKVGQLVDPEGERRAQAYRDLCHLLRLPSYAALDGVGGFVEKGDLYGATVVCWCGTPDWVTYAYGLPTGDVKIFAEKEFSKKLEVQERMRAGYLHLTDKEEARLLGGRKVQIREQLSKVYAQEELLAVSVLSAAPPDHILHQTPARNGLSLTSVVLALSSWALETCGAVAAVA